MRVNPLNGLPGLLRFVAPQQEGVRDGRNSLGDGKLRVKRGEDGCYALRTSTKGPGTGPSKSLGRLARKRQDVAEFLGSVAQRLPDGAVRNERRSLSTRALIEDIRSIDLQPLLAAAKSDPPQEVLLLADAPGQAGHKTLLYVPGLATAQNLAQAPEPVEGETEEEFRQRDAENFRNSVSTSFQTDLNTFRMVQRLLGAGAQPARCQRPLSTRAEWPAPTGEPHLRHAPQPAVVQPEAVQAAVPQFEVSQLKGPQAEASQARALHAQASEPEATEPPTTLRHKNLGRLLGDMPTTAVLAKKAGQQVSPIRMRDEGGNDAVPRHAPGIVAQLGPTARRGTSLAGLRDGDTLYVVGHSNANVATLSFAQGAQDNASVLHIEPSVLAGQLINDGLPPQDKCHVVLVSCFSGGIKNRRLETVQPMANSLKRSLRDQGFCCEVYGATGLPGSMPSVSSRSRRRSPLWKTAPCWPKARMPSRSRSPRRPSILSTSARRTESSPRPRSSIGWSMEPIFSRTTQEAARPRQRRAAFSFPRSLHEHHRARLVVDRLQQRGAARAGAGPRGAAQAGRPRSLGEGSP